MRCFISIAPPAEVVRQIAALQEQAVAAIGAELSARTLDSARAEKFHLTLRFLGEMRPEQRPALENELAQISTQHLPLTLQIAHIGVFPNMRRPAVLWLGIDASDALMRLQGEVERAAQKAGFVAEARSYSPHLTLARVRRSVQGGSLKSLAEGIQRASNDPVVDGWRAEFVADAIELMRSELMPQGARYTVLREFALRSG